MIAISAEGDDIPQGMQTILIAEDDQDLLATYKVWLSEYDNYEVITVTDGSQAMEILPDDVDVFICDRRMPELSGPEVLEQLQEYDHDIRTIVVSAYEPDSGLSEEDVDRYITKPVQKGNIAAAIEDVLDEE